MSADVRPEWIDEAVRLYESGLSMRAVGAQVGHASVEYWFRKLGIPVRSSGAQAQDLSETAQRAVDLYLQDVAVRAIAAEIGCAPGTIYGYLDKAGVPRRQASTRKAPAPWVPAAVRLCERDGLTNAQIAERLSVDESSVAKALRRQLGPRAAGRARVQAAVLARTVELYVEKALSLEEVAALTGVTASTVRNRLDKAGVARRPAGTPIPTDQRVQEAIDAYLDGQSLRQAGALVGATAPTVRAWLIERGIERREAKRTVSEDKREQARRLRTEDKQSLAQIAAALGVSRSTVRRWCQ